MKRLCCAVAALCIASFVAAEADAQGRRVAVRRGVRTIGNVQRIQSNVLRRVSNVGRTIVRRPTVRHGGFHRGHGGFRHGHGGFRHGHGASHSCIWHGGRYCYLPSCYQPCYYQNWSCYCWFPQWGCYGYYCPTQCCWFYHCPQFGCYLPISYMTQFQPAGFNAININNTNVNTNVAGPGNVVGGPALPAGAQAVGAAPVMPGVTP